MGDLQTLAIWVIPVLFAITLHEVAHGWIAGRLGDPTARRLGRLSLNPIKHIDPIGTVVVPLLLFLTAGFIFGWARPVPVTYENLRRPRRDMALVALAGPGANLLMALLWALVIKLVLILPGLSTPMALGLIAMGKAGVAINAILMVLNLLPIPPLDGSKVLSGVLPGRYSYSLSRLEPYGFMILLLLLVTGVLGGLLWPAVSGMMHGIGGLFGIHSFL